MRAVFAVAVLAFAACTNAESTGLNEAPPNTDFGPAFEGQTRALEAESGFDLEVAEVAVGLSHPWAIAILPDGRLLISERPGWLRLVDQVGAMSAPIEGLPPVDARDQGGLLDVALSPNFASDRLVYWSYAEPRGGENNGTSVARGRLSEDATRIEAATVIFRQTPDWRSTGHYGGALAFDRDGRLFIALGERQRSRPRRLAQDVSTLLGKVVRVEADGAVPADNPFVGQNGARGEIWSYGHRNPQGAAIHPETGALWTIEHGPQGGDELNIAAPGRNYGWPIISYGEEYGGEPIGQGLAVREGMEQPVYYWDPVIAPGDMIFYQGDLFPWRGDLLIAGLRSRALVRLRLVGARVVGEERFDLGARVRDVEQAADGALWVVTDEDDGRLLRLTPRR
ncbi:MAG: PQQ-dependent sugar dehydrogenase [Hyphomonadaceae bacterium]|nr:PQQ-dependent sugar dehydrogenase [Hyphomonadaceae bacterium]